MLTSHMTARSDIIVLINHLQLWLTITHFFIVVAHCFQVFRSTYCTLFPQVGAFCRSLVEGRTRGCLSGFEFAAADILIQFSQVSLGYSLLESFTLNSQGLQFSSLNCYGGDLNFILRFLETN